MHCSKVCRLRSDAGALSPCSRATHVGLEPIVVCPLARTPTRSMPLARSGDVGTLLPSFLDQPRGLLRCYAEADLCEAALLPASSSGLAGPPRHSAGRSDGELEGIRGRSWWYSIFQMVTRGVADHVNVRRFVQATLLDRLSALLDVVRGARPRGDGCTGRRIDLVAKATHGSDDLFDDIIVDDVGGAGTHFGCGSSDASTACSSPDHLWSPGAPHSNLKHLADSLGMGASIC